MLCRLIIRNIALIDELTVDFGFGFSALTGETGAGKSIVVDSMNLALGERADRELIRSGAERAQVEALFDISKNARTLSILEELGIECEDGQLIIIRELAASGRNICRVNGSMQPLTALRRLTMSMVDLHGQHEHQSLLDDGKHIEYLDAYGKESIAGVKQAVAAAYLKWARAVRQLKKQTGSARDRAQRVDMLAFQIKEIDGLRLEPGEEERLTARRDRLRNAVAIGEALAGANALLNGGDDSPGAAGELSDAARLLQEIGEYSPEYARLAATLSEALFAVQDVASEVDAAFFSLDGESGGEAALDRIEDRLGAIEAIKRKYGGDIKAVLAHRDEAQEELDALSSSEETAMKLEGRIRMLREELVGASRSLSKARGEWARRYEAEVLSHLKDLGMERAQFLIEIMSPEENARKFKFTPDGFDQVRFLFSANAGEAPRPLSRIASGGEMSRVMLALKNVAAEYGDVGCLIFDEIDTGISGRMAQVVGEKIARIAKNRQVICVTHLPQIACMADRQYIVFKEDEQGRAHTYVRPLDEMGRIAEIARLVGGAGDEAIANEHAASMLKAAGERKKHL